MKNFLKPARKKCTPEQRDLAILFIKAFKYPRPSYISKKDIREWEKAHEIKSLPMPEGGGNELREADIVFAEIMGIEPHPYVPRNDFENYEEESDDDPNWEWIREFLDGLVPRWFWSKVQTSQWLRSLYTRCAAFPRPQIRRPTRKKLRYSDRVRLGLSNRPTISQEVQRACRMAAWRIQNAASSISPHSGKNNYVKRPIFITKKDEPTE